MRAAAARRARYGTVVSPTMVASTRAAEARMSVAQRLPDSRETVENSAAANARKSPTIASKNRTHTSGISICKNREICLNVELRSGALTGAVVCKRTPF